MAALGNAIDDKDPRTTRKRLLHLELLGWISKIDAPAGRPHTWQIHKRLPAALRTREALLQERLGRPKFSNRVTDHTAAQFADKTGGSIMAHCMIAAFCGKHHTTLRVRDNGTTYDHAIRFIAARYEVPWSTLSAHLAANAELHPALVTKTRHGTHTVDVVDTDTGELVEQTRQRPATFEILEPVTGRRAPRPQRPPTAKQLVGMASRAEDPPALWQEANDIMEAWHDQTTTTAGTQPQTAARADGT